MEEFQKQAKEFLDRAESNYKTDKAQFEYSQKELERAKKIASCNHELEQDNSNFALWEIRCKKCGFSLMY